MLPVFLREWDNPPSLKQIYTGTFKGFILVGEILPLIRPTRGVGGKGKECFSTIRPLKYCCSEY